MRSWRNGYPSRPRLHLESLESRDVPSIAASAMTIANSPSATGSGSFTDSLVDSPSQTSGQQEQPDSLVALLARYSHLLGPRSFTDSWERLELPSLSLLANSANSHGSFTVSLNGSFTVSLANSANSHGSFATPGPALSGAMVIATFDGIDPNENWYPVTSSNVRGVAASRSENGHLRRMHNRESGVDISAETNSLEGNETASAFQGLALDKGADRVFGFDRSLEQVDSALRTANLPGIGAFADVTSLGKESLLQVVTLLSGRTAQASSQKTANAGLSAPDALADAALEAWWAIPGGTTAAKVVRISRIAQAAETGSSAIPDDDYFMEAMRQLLADSGQQYLADGAAIGLFALFPRDHAPWNRHSSRVQRTGEFEAGRE